VTVTKKVKMISKISAIQENSKLQGMYFADQQPERVQGFAFLLEFAKFIEGGVKASLPPEVKAIDV